MTESGKKHSKRGDADAPEQGGAASVRLQKFLAQAGVASRRKAEEMILAGKVTVNGRLIKELGVKVVPGQDRVMLGRHRIESAPRRVILFHKPRGFTCVEDPNHKEQSIQFIFPPVKDYPVALGLERQASGLVVLTNDGEMLQALAARNRDLPKTYHIRVRETITKRDLEKLTSGISLETGRFRLDSITYLEDDPDGRPWYEVVMRNQRGRALEGLFLAVGRPAQRIRLVEVAGLRDDGLAKGEGRSLTQSELRKLRESAGLGSAKSAGKDADDD